MNGKLDRFLTRLYTYRDNSVILITLSLPVLAFELRVLRFRVRVYTKADSEI